MGDHDVKTNEGGNVRREFMRHLFNDLHALENMLAEDLIESDIRRIGAEQEMFLIDRSARPAMVAVELLERLADDKFTTELGQFNLELNLPPLVFGGDCLSRLETELVDRLDHVKRVAAEMDTQILLTGILPTLRKSDLALSNMTPEPRYFALNDSMNALRGGAYELHIKGVDELLLKHDSVMLEACNASFQVHFQVGAEEFANLYNIAQAIAAPVLAAAVNSPVLFGRRLWAETRIALFQQSVDTRSALADLRERSPRVSFGRGWVRDSVLELFQEDIARFRALVVREIQSDSLNDLREGNVPKLEALCLYNSTVYRWNRACYGISKGKAHLRIENRVLPSGPTPTDEVANAAFWFGLLSSMSQRFEDISRVMEFEDAAMNFTSAARLGLDAQFAWINGETLPAATLICEKLLPAAREGLLRRGIDEGDVDRYLGIIERRVSRSKTGAAWQVNSLADMRGHGSAGERLNALTAAMAARQTEGEPVAEWDGARLDESGGWKHNFVKVEQYMTTELFTVNEDESLDLVAYMMEWERIRHVPVENARHELIGLVSYRALLRQMARGRQAAQRQVAVAQIMKRDPVVISPEDSTLRAIELMREHKIGCLPVVKDDRLIGIITERDLMNVAAELLEQQLKED